MSATRTEVIHLPGGDPDEFLRQIARGALVGARAWLAAIVSESSAPVAEHSDVMTADEVASWLRLDRKTVYDYAGRGVIPHQRIGKRMLFSRVALVQWLGSCSKGSSERGSG